MNCVELFTQQAKSRPGQMAIWVPGQEAMSFGDLLKLGARAQTLFRREGIQPGDHVLIIDHLGPRLYASVTALLALGACVVLVEPWMPIREIERVVSLIKPKIFLANMLGKAWGLRVPAVRAIPKWIHPNRVESEKDGDLVIESLGEESPGILTFTSGTTGKPKGVVRNQGYLVNQHKVLSRALDLEKHDGPDLCIFANFALANLASGRGSIIVPPRWLKKHLKAIANVQGEMAPKSLTCGPAFLIRLMDTVQLPSLESIHVGGALTDCWIFEKAFGHFPKAHFMHVYGSSEAEPVALADAHEAVRLSRAKGLFQTLYLGKTVDEISSKIEPDGVWVAGSHVCPRYLGNEEENRLNKKTDEQGRVWHFMGDRVRADENGWWYSGRSSQSVDLFDLEQKLYATIGTSKAFLQPGEAQILAACIQDPGKRDPALTQFLQTSLRPNEAEVFKVKIRRDRRHRARIDRAATWKTRRKWRIG